MNFKRRFSFILAIYFLFTSVGFAFNIHYCGDEIASVSTVFSLEEPCEMESEAISSICCETDSKDHDDCCSDETIQSDYDDIVVNKIDFDFNFAAVITVIQSTTFIVVDTVACNQTFDYYCDANAPPFYKLYSQLIFYA